MTKPYENEYLVTAAVKFHMFADTAEDAEAAVADGLYRTITVPALMHSDRANFVGTESSTRVERVEGYANYEDDSPRD